VDLNIASSGDEEEESGQKFCSQRVARDEAVILLGFGVVSGCQVGGGLSTKIPSP
jgi:hypothetical protein